jgi:hypothetical protein
VLSGRCRLTFHQPVELSAGQFAELPGGDFQLTALGPEQLAIVSVWLLPEKFRSAT